LTNGKRREVEKRTCTAQTYRNLFEYRDTESVLGKQQELDVPLQEPHADNELKLGLGLGLRLRLQAWFTEQEL